MIRWCIALGDVFGGIMVSFWRASYRIFFCKYVTFSGRATRSEVWYGTGCLLALLVMAWGGGFMLTDRMPASAEIIVLPVIAMTTGFSLLLLPPMVALHIRRLHDHNVSGWWYLFAWVILAAGIAISQPYLSMIVAVGLMGVFYLLPGSKGDNKFGKNPKKLYGHGYFQETISVK